MRAARARRAVPRRADARGRRPRAWPRRCPSRRRRSCSSPRSTTTRCQAFDAAALDYLLKPADAEHVARAVQRCCSAAQRRPRRAPRRRASCVIPDRGRTWVVAVAEIEWLEAADNYVVVHAGARAPLLRRTLTALLADLGDGFVRTQRGAAVALAQVASVQSLPRATRPWCCTAARRCRARGSSARQLMPSVVAGAGLTSASPRRSDPLRPNASGATRARPPTVAAPLERPRSSPCTPPPAPQRLLLPRLAAHRRLRAAGAVPRGHVLRDLGLAREEPLRQRRARAVHAAVARRGGCRCCS